jgi:hypothetical protein
MDDILVFEAKLSARLNEQNVFAKEPEGKLRLYIPKIFTSTLKS